MYDKGVKTMIEQFKNWLTINGYAENTVTGYIQKLRDFLKVVPEDFTEDKVNNYLLTLKEKFSAETVNYYSKAIKKFFEFKNINVRLPKNLKIDNKLPDSISEEYFLDKIIPMADTIFTKHLKAKAILSFIFYTGVRRSEISILKRKDIDLEKRLAKIYVPKRKEERLVVLPKVLIVLLEVYFKTEPEIKNAFNTGRGCIDGIFLKLRPYFQDINLRPHLLRHSYATHCLDKGIDVSKVSKLLGHKDIKSTQRYLDLDVNKIQKEIDEKF